MHKIDTIFKVKHLQSMDAQKSAYESEQTVISGLMCTDKDKDTEQNGRERRKSESSAGKGGVAVSFKQITTYFNLII